MKQIKEIAFTGYPITDMPRAKAFYEGILGLEPSSDFENGGKHWTEYEIAGGTFAITDMNPDWKPSGDGPAVAFEVSDFDVTIAALRAAGARFCVEPMTSPVCRMAVVFDPSGNCVVIHKRNAD